MDFKERIAAAVTAAKRNIAGISAAFREWQAEREVERKNAPAKTTEKKTDFSNGGLQRDYRRRMNRSVQAETSRAVSSTKGTGPRAKKSGPKSKTYKPELNRF